MSRAFNLGMPRIGKPNPKRCCIDGITLQSVPTKGYTGYWRSENKRVILRRVKKRDNWTLLVDGQDAGAIGLHCLTDFVRANDYLIRKTL